MFRYNFRKYLTELGITMNTNILVAVSGGIDSMSLLDILKNCSLNLNIFVANVNFNLRGQESNQDTQMVIDYCQNLNIKLFTKSFNTIQYAKEKNISIEMAARELRYNWFFELMEQHNLTYLAIAHNSNDNAETLLLNLTRGTGIDGITGIKEILPINNNKFIIRPLLQYTRDEIEKYATKYNIPFRTDSTNQLSDYHRNRIRNEVFPQLKKSIHL
jgi:tRNA(Ile)-lysidine synthetase, N-terminal domain